MKMSLETHRSKRNKAAWRSIRIGCFLCLCGAAFFAVASVAKEWIWVLPGYIFWGLSFLWFEEPAIQDMINEKWLGDSN